MNRTLAGGTMLLAASAAATAAARRRRAAGTVAHEIRGAGGRAAAHTVDVTDAGAVGRLADLVFADGPVDLLFNNAGIGQAAAVADTTLCPGVINTAIVTTSTMRGEWAGRRARTVDLYARRGTSPDVVARQALTGVTRGRRIIPTPRYLVVPHWLLKRVLPPAGRGMSVATYRYLSKSP